MERTLDELKAEMEYWQAEIKRVKDREGDARVRYYAAEREVQRNKKLTQGQLAILRRLADGQEIQESAWHYPTRYTISANGNSDSVAASVIDGLCKRDCILRERRGERGYAYMISDWGREVLSRLTARKGAA